MFNLGQAIGYLILDTSGFTSGFQTARTELQRFMDSENTAQGRLQALGSAFTSVGATMTKSVTLPLVGIGTAATVTASNFERSMSQVQATLGITSDAMSELDGQSVNTMDALSDLAQEMGASTKFSATEAAAAINNMAMAGYSVQEIYDALPQVLSLASAGALDLDYATQLVANGLNVMGMETSNAQELADKLAVTASNAYGSVSDFGEGLLVAGAQAKLANVNLTDTMTALGILGDNGIAASEGGTYLRNTLKNLYTPTKDAAEALNELGVKTSESDGTLRDFQDVLGDLGAALDGLTEEQRITYMSRIFDTRTISAANALIENSGKRWDELSSAIDGAGGAADRMAQTQLDNLSGQLTILKSSIEGAAISFGSILLPVIKQLTTVFQNLMNWLNSLDESQKKTLVTILEVVAAIGPIFLIIGKILKTISSLIGILKTLKTAMIAVNAVLAANPIILVIAAIAALVAAFIYLWNNCEEFRNFWINLWNTLVTAFNAAVEWIRTGIDNVITFFQELPTTISNIWEQVKQFCADAIDSIISRIASWGASLWSNATYAFTQMWLAIKAVWEDIKSWFSNGITDLVNIVTNLGTELYNSGKNAITQFWDGLKSTWDSIVEWAKSAINKLKGIFTINLSASGSTASYATGVDYIPRDMMVKVHEGEAIVTKEDNRSRKPTGGDTYNFYSPKALTPTEASKQFKRVQKELALG